MSIDEADRRLDIELSIDNLSSVCTSASAMLGRSCRKLSVLVVPHHQLVLIVILQDWASVKTTLSHSPRRLLT